jgi:hypothetical protein
MPQSTMAQNRPSEADSAAQLASLRYSEAIKGIDSQRSVLSELRSRTGLLISAASISTSFLGSVAAKGKPGFPLVFLWAIIPFGISIGLALLILLPWRGWRFSLRSGTFAAFKGKASDEVLTELADIVDVNTDTNQTRINILNLLFAISALTLLWSIIAWIVVIE